MLRIKHQLVEIFLDCLKKLIKEDTGKDEKTDFVKSQKYLCSDNQSVLNLSSVIYKASSHLVEQLCKISVRQERTVEAC